MSHRMAFFSRGHDAAGAVRERILAFLRARGESGATDEELQTILDLDGNSERPRRVELQRQRLVRDSGRLRLTRAGKSATIWIACSLPRLDPLASRQPPKPAGDPAATWPEDLVVWVMTLQPSDLAPQFLLKSGVFVANSARFLANLQQNLQAGPSGPRARFGALQEELALLHRVVGATQARRPSCDATRDLGTTPGDGGKVLAPRRS